MKSSRKVKNYCTHCYSYLSVVCVLEDVNCFNASSISLNVSSKGFCSAVLREFLTSRLLRNESSNNNFSNLEITDLNLNLLQLWEKYFQQVEKHGFLQKNLTH